MPVGDARDRHGLIRPSAVTEPSLTWLPGRRGWSFLLVPGLVPDGPETFARQIPVLRRYGDVAVMSYPPRRFDLENALRTMREILERAARMGRPGVLVGASVGGGMCVELLRRCQREGIDLPLSALVLVSPLCSTRDLSPVLRRLLEPILVASDEESSHAALERGRAFFRSLAQRAGQALPGSPPGARHRLMPFARRSGTSRDDHLRSRILATIDSISAEGGIERCRAVGQLSGLDPASRPPVLTKAPTLILWGSKERNTINMDGPGAGVLSRPDLACRHFSQVEVQWVYTANGSEVPHASLVLHHQAFNAALHPFLSRCRRRHATPSARLLQFARLALARDATAPVS